MVAQKWKVIRGELFFPPGEGRKVLCANFSLSSARGGGAEDKAFAVFTETICLPGLKIAIGLVVFATVLTLVMPTALAADMRDKENWWCHSRFDTFSPSVIAVLPMDNFSLEPDLESHLFREIYRRLDEKGYMKIEDAKVRAAMDANGIQTPGQLAGISASKLGKQMNCDAVLMGRIDQSGAVHAGVYDAVVVSCSLWLVHCESGETLWRTEQWRTAHRQWQIDPVNLLLNFAVHENASRTERISWLVHKMLETLPPGPVRLDHSNLLEQAAQIEALEK